MLTTRRREIPCIISRVFISILFFLQRCRGCDMFIHSGTIPGTEHGGPHITHAHAQSYSDSNSGNNPSAPTASGSEQQHQTQSQHLFKRRKLEHVPALDNLEQPAATCYVYPPTPAASTRPKNAHDFAQPNSTSRDKGEESD